MFSIYRWLYNLVGFSRSQSNAFIILLPLLALILFSEPVYRWSIENQSIPSDEKRHLDSLVSLFDPPAKDTVHRKPSSRKPIIVQLIPFDPNKATLGELRSVGFESFIAGRIVKYRQRGGVFRYRADLLRIHGLDTAFFAQIRPFIQLPDRTDRAPFPSRAVWVPAKRFDLNTADTATLKRVRGIGEKLSLRIIKYRNALGGFRETGQLAEVYHLDTAVVRELEKHCFVDSDFRPRKHHLNLEPADSLALHPYISRRTAGAIVAYRIRHGKFQSVEDLELLDQFDSVMLRKVMPYVTVSE
jgi:competence protein ComEA